VLKVEHRKMLAAVKRYEAKAKRLFRKIERDLEAGAPDLDAYDWPEPEEGEEDSNPLFDSTRDYIEQVGRYKHHQGKQIVSAAKLSRQNPVNLSPIVCQNPDCPRGGEPFVPGHKNTLVCSKACGNRVGYLRSKGRLPADTPKRQLLEPARRSMSPDERRAKWREYAASQRERRRRAGGSAQP
jgi:hypothetical protein